MERADRELGEADRPAESGLSVQKNVAAAKRPIFARANGAYSRAGRRWALVSFCDKRRYFRHTLFCKWPIAKGYILDIGRQMAVQTRVFRRTSA